MERLLRWSRVLAGNLLAPLVRKDSRPDSVVLKVASTCTRSFAASGNPIDRRPIPSEASVSITSTSSCQPRAEPTAFLSTDSFQAT